MVAYTTGWPEQQRAAEIAVQQVGVPAPELGQQRLIQAEVVADVGDLLRRGGQPGDGGGGIAGDHVDHAEGDQADDQQDRHRAAQPTDAG